MTKTTLDEKGSETLRLLRKQFGRTKRQTVNSTWMRIVPQNFDENDFSELLTDRGFGTSEYKRVAQDKLPDLLKTTLLISKTSGAMYRYLCMQLDDLTTCQRANTMIVNYCGTSASTTNVYAGNPRGAETVSAPMEIDALYHGKR